MTSSTHLSNTEIQTIHEIERSASDPRSWLKFIEREATINDKENHNQKVRRLYELACKSLDPFQYRKDEDFAKLLISKAKYEE